MEMTEEKNVMISVQGLQDYDGTDPDDVELVTEGKLSERDGVLHLSYEESALTGMEGTTTLFHVEPKRITLLRMGTVSSELVFELGKRHMSLYDTPYGNMEVGVLARKIRSTLGSDGGELEVDYDIDINHVVAGESLFRVDVHTLSDGLKS